MKPELRSTISRAMARADRRDEIQEVWLDADRYTFFLNDESRGRPPKGDVHVATVDSEDILYLNPSYQ